jgi:hypothetical protein
VLDLQEANVRQCLKIVNYGFNDVLGFRLDD